MKKVKIYSTPGCHYCKEAKEFFTRHGVKYEEFDVVSDLGRRQEMVDISGQMGVPVIVIEGEVQAGWDQAQAERALGIAS